MNDVVLEARNLSRRFREGPLDVSVLEDVSLQVQRGQTVAIVGASGSGKSTLLHILGGLDQPSGGSVDLMGARLASMTPAALGRWRNLHLGFVYQFHHLLAELDALENVGMPLWIARRTHDVRVSRARTILTEVGLEHRLAHRPSELSGGERQRVAIARALVNQPACVLADEPTGNLDRSTAGGVFDLMIRLARQRGTAFVVVTHDEELARRCDARWRLLGGRLTVL